MKQRCHARLKKSILLISTLLVCLGFNFDAYSDVRTFVREYAYQASELDSKASCRSIALEQVKRLLLEELGTYIESQTEVRDFQLTKDRISALAVGIVKVEILDERWDGRSYFLKAALAADPEQVAAEVNRLRQDTRKSEELEKLQQETARALAEIEQMKKAIKKSKGKSDQALQYNRSLSILDALANADKGFVIGSKIRKIYHRPTCEWARKIDSINLIVFDLPASAEKNGYRPCKVCFDNNKKFRTYKYNKK